MDMNDRQKKIIDILREKKRVSVAGLAKTLFVCEMTIRRDLKEMEKSNLLKRYHGGAVYIDGDEYYPLQIRQCMYEDEKKSLCKKSEKYLKDGQTIYIENSSTCLYIIPYLRNYKDILVVTNSVQALLLLSEIHIPCMLAGGMYSETDMCLVGSDTEEFLRGINADVAFFSADGLSEDGFITNIDHAQTAVAKVMMKNSEKKIFLLTTSKLNKKYTYTFCRKEDATDIIII